MFCVIRQIRTDGVGAAADPAVVGSASGAAWQRKSPGGLPKALALFGSTTCGYVPPVGVPAPGILGVHGPRRAAVGVAVTPDESFRKLETAPIQSPSFVPYDYMLDP